MRNTQVKPLSGIEVAFGMGHLMPFAKGEAVSRSEMRDSLGEPYCRGEGASDIYQLEPTGYIERQYDKDRFTNYIIQRYDSGEPN